MSQLELLKNELHQLIDRVDDEAMLTRLLGAISSEVGDWWDGVSAEEKAEILEAYEESKNPANLVSHEEVKQRYAKWLTK